MTRKIVRNSRTAKKKVPPKKAKKKIIPKETDSNIYGFEQLVAGISGSKKRHLPSTKFDAYALHTFHNVTPVASSTAGGMNRVTLLTIAPHFVFTHWEISAMSMIEAAEKIGPDAKLTLRFYDITENNDFTTCPFWDVEVFDRQGNWYLKLENPEQKLYVEIGMKSQTRPLSRISGADIMHMPAAVIAEPGPLKWLVSKTGDPTRPDFAEGRPGTQEYMDVDQDLLKKVLGPYFHDLLMRGRFGSIANSSVEAIFHDIHSLRPDK